MAKRIIKLSSPAKLNLALQVVNRRPDGYHDLRTIFERISLADTLTFRPRREGIHISCDHPSVPCDERNLVHKVARLLKESYGVKLGVWIDIQKRIPVAAGLAGGSSNAATALIGLNRLWNLGLSQKELVALAKQVGSDVSFFLYDRPFALGTGRGDRIKVLDMPGKFWHVLITPKAPLLTKDVYREFSSRYFKSLSSAEKMGGSQLTRGGSDVTMLTRSLRKQDIAGIQRLIFNDLEGSIGFLRPELLRLKDRLMRFQPQGVCFSGSGPSIFVLTRNRAEAETIARHFRRIYTQVFVVTTD